MRRLWSALRVITRHCAPAQWWYKMNDVTGRSHRWVLLDSSCIRLCCRNVMNRTIAAKQYDNSLFNVSTANRLRFFFFFLARIWKEKLSAAGACRRLPVVACLCSFLKGDTRTPDSTHVIRNLPGTPPIISVCCLPCNTGNPNQNYQVRITKVHTNYRHQTCATLPLVVGVIFAPLTVLF